MKLQILIDGVKDYRLAAAGLAIALFFGVVPARSVAQEAPANFSPALQQVVTLSKGGMSEEFILSYIANAHATYKLGVDEILYLHNQGVSDKIIKALGPTAASVNPAPPPPVAPPTAAPASVIPAAPAPPPGAPAVVYNPVGAPPGPPPAGPPGPGLEINFNYFHDQLSPFGSWIEINGVMYWRPDAALRANPDWRPYYDMGQWIQTENGLYWQSDYNWGDIPFHYGRWVIVPGRGWLWAPDYEWGPSWVFWRHHEEGAMIGWAPLPVGAVFIEGRMHYHGVVVAEEFDFGLGEVSFTFVGYDHFHEGFRRWRGHEWGYHLGPERVHVFYGRSVIRNEFRRDEHGRFVNHGIGRERMERVTHVEHASFVERHPVGDRNSVAAAQPAKSGSATPAVAKAGATGTASAGNRPAATATASASTPGAKQPGAATPAPAPAASAPVSKVYRPPTPAANVAASQPKSAPAAPKPQTGKQKP